MNYDLIIYGGGVSGVSAAYTAAKTGIKTLLIEKTDTLGGSASQGLVMPVMKVNSENINTNFVSDLKLYADKYNARHTFIDGNELWLNTELLKIVFDDMLSNTFCTVLFSSEPLSITAEDDIFNNVINHKTSSLNIKSKYIIDASADGIAFKLLGCGFQKKSDKKQMPSMRFIISGINMPVFADWLENLDPDRNITPIERASSQIYLSSAYTWDKNKNWALAPIFEQALQDNALKYEDTAYFQFFSIPNMPDSLNFNAPRILLKDNEDLSSPFVYSRCLIEGRARIFRLYKFCRKYLKGFENSYISNISSMLGVRESARVKGAYTASVNDITAPKTLKNAAFASDYPIDIHARSSEDDKLKQPKKTYYIPIEALISEKYSNLYGIGRIISSDFEAHSALRVQMSCFSMGEAAAKDIAAKIFSK